MALTIAVVGGGFGGTYAIKELDRLRQSLSLDLEVLLFEPRSGFVFTPLLHEVATAGLDTDHVRVPFTALYDGKPWIRHVHAAVSAVNPGKRLVTAGGKQYPYDYLLLATGSTTNYYGNKGLSRHTLTLKDEKDAENIRFRLEQALLDAAQTRDPAKQRRFLTVAVVGGGPTGVELAAEIAQFFRHRLRTLYRKVGKDAVQVVLFQGAPVLLPHASPRMQAAARRALERLGITVLCGAKVEHVHPGFLTYELLGEQQKEPVGLTIWVAGITPRTIPGCVESKFYQVNPDLSLIGHEDAFAIGDAACYDERCMLDPVPALAQVAVQEGTMAAQNIVRRIRGDRTEPFLYKSKGFLVSLGQKNAAGEIETPFGTVFLKGFLMWWLWRTVYLFKFLDAKQRVQNAMSWTGRLFSKRSVRAKRSERTKKGIRTGKD